ncbi:MAG: hypothetical protein ABIB71_01470 [Candidatus Woesearchaeota archaeon]
MRNKSGQVTAFVIIGIVIVSILGLLFMMKSQIMEATGINEKISTISFSDDVADVEAHVQKCLDESLKEAVFFYTDKDVGGIYEDVVAQRMQNSAYKCIDFNQFTRVSVRSLSRRDIRVEKFGDRISSTLYYEIRIEKGDNSDTLDSFHSEFKLTRKCCIPVEVDYDCKAQDSGDYHVCGLVYNVWEGKELKAGGECLAC